MSCLDQSPPALGHGTSLPIDRGPTPEESERHKRYFFDTLEGGEDPVRMNRYPKGIDPDLLGNLFWEFYHDGLIGADKDWKLSILHNPYRE